MDYYIEASLLHLGGVKRPTITFALINAMYILLGMPNYIELEYLLKASFRAGKNNHMHTLNHHFQ